MTLPGEVLVPPALAANASRGPAWASWLDALPRLTADVLGSWELSVDGASTSGSCALVVPVRTRVGQPAVVKLGWPHPEAAYEHLALRAWGGDGAVRLLQADPRRSVLLLERADPGHDLESMPVLQACEVVAGLYGRLHRPALPQLDRLSDHAARWSEELAVLLDSRQVPRRFVEQARSLARDFASDPGTDGRLIHTDLHYGNVLAAEREPWLVIDPKPLSGDPAYEVAPLLGNRWDDALASGDVRAAVLDRMYTLVDAAGLDEDRVRDWVTVRMVVDIAWALRELADQPTTPDWITAGTTILKAVQR